MGTASSGFAVTVAVARAVVVDVRVFLTVVVRVMVVVFSGGVTVLVEGWIPRQEHADAYWFAFGQDLVA